MKKATTNTIDVIRNILKTREIFTPAELVKLGIYGSRSAIYKSVNLGLLEAIYISPQRMVITKESIINHLSKFNSLHS